jgi:hypothetical protein
VNDTLVSRAFSHLLIEANDERGTFDFDASTYVGKCVSSELPKKLGRPDLVLLPCAFPGCDHRVFVPKKDVIDIAKCKLIYCSCCSSKL